MKGLPSKDWTTDEFKDLYERAWDAGMDRNIALQEEIMRRPVSKRNEVGLLWRTFFEKERLVVLRRFLDGIEVDRDTTVLDIGCGLTVFSEIYGPEECPKVTAVDIAENILEFQRRRFPHIGFRYGDAQDLRLDGKWDVVHAGEVAEHLFFPRRAIDRWCKYVKDDGWMIVTTPTPTFKRVEGQHVRFVSEGDVRRIFRANGIRLVQVHGLVPFIPILANMILRMRSVPTRNRIYNWYMGTTYRYPMFSSQAFYLGKKEWNGQARGTDPGPERY